MIEQELNQYWQTVVNTIQDGVMIVDMGGTIISANKALSKMTGYSSEELIGKKCSILNCSICERARKGNEGHFCSLFSTGKLNLRRCALMRPDGTYVHVLKNASLLKESNGEVIGAVETLTDISELIEKDTTIEAFRRELLSEDGYRGIIGASAPMQQVFDLIANAARSDAPVIIYGESGTGKELIAKAIHETGIRNNQPYIKVNCAALNENLLDSELFGHVKGAYTGAYQGRKGRFEDASGGDIFLDEIGDLPYTTQVKLLRVLEEKVIERVGDNRPVNVDVRFITATNRNLRQLISDGVFREDLFYRINVIPVFIPPLRERRGDIPLLAESFFRKIRLKNDSLIIAISNSAMEVLMNYPWPGNVRELKSALEYAFVTCQGTEILPDHLPPDITSDNRSSVGKKQRVSDRNVAQKTQLLAALKQSGGNQSKAADLLGVSRVTVWNRMKKFGIATKRQIHQNM